MTACTVLYIEDNLDNADLITRRLHRVGITPLVAENGQEGIVMAMQHHPNLILMDFNLPDIDGVEVMRRLRRNADFADIPIVMVTADTSPATRRKAYEVGCQGYLHKPVNKEDLFAVLRKHLHLELT